MLTLGVASFIAIMVVLITAMDSRRERALYLKEFQERGGNAANTLNEVLADPLYFSDVDRVDDLVDKFRNQIDVRYVKVYDSSSRLLIDSDLKDYPAGLQSADPLLEGAIRNRELQYDTKGDILRVAGPIDVGPDIVGAVEIGYSSDAVDAELAAIIGERIRQLVVLLVLGVVISYLLAQYIVRPVRRLVGATELVAGGEYAFKAELNRTDEIGQLARSFESMTRALRSAHDEMEDRVDERTAQLRESEEAARALSRQLVEVQESERRFIAQELHDEIGQDLTALALALEKNRVAESNGDTPDIDRGLEIVREVTAKVRDLSLRLRPSVLDDLGLLPALIWLTDRYGSQSGLLVQFEHSSLGERLPADIETAAYRIIQEGLNNVVRHAQTTEATVVAKVDDSALRIEIEDAGGGFEPAGVGTSNKLRMSGMRERAELLGGTFIVESVLGTGTRLAINLPLNGRNGAG